MRVATVNLKTSALVTLVWCQQPVTIDLGVLILSTGDLGTIPPIQESDDWQR